VTDRPIIMSAPMVRACLREIEKPGTGKTQTRRLRYRILETVFSERNSETGKLVEIKKAVETPWTKVQPGDRLWVRENAWICPPNWTDTPANPMGPNRQEVAYQADDVRGGTAEAARDYKLKLRPSIHMPRWASRITLLVSAVKVEKLTAINGNDAIAEGLIDLRREGERWHWDPNAVKGYFAPWRAFRALWDSIHGEGSFDDGGEVVAITFKPVLENIDRIKEAA